MGLGVLGQLAVKIAHTAGAVPVIAVDPVKERREDALKNGADFAFDPYEENFVEKVKKVSGGGVNVTIEVTGVGAGFDGALDCMAKFGRVALLGCTRDKNFTIDYYRKIHGPGITVIGAHTLARPENESHSGYFTHRDDIKALLKLFAAGRMNVKNMISRQYSPEECQGVFDGVMYDKTFPPIVQFDWRK
jgi:threonine dehydrogenase-like Zn-dependent dehydrogenase